MEWNFRFRIDVLNERGEERELKGTLFTAGEEEPPSPEAIVGFLRQSGYAIDAVDGEHLIFRGSREGEPIEIRIVQLGSGEEPDGDLLVRKLAEQFRKPDPAIG